MSRFLHNLARRGAGLPVASIQAPPPSPFGPEIPTPGPPAIEAEPGARDEGPSEPWRIAGAVPETLHHPVIQRFSAPSGPAARPAAQPTLPTPPAGRPPLPGPPSPPPARSLPPKPGREPAAPGVPSPPPPSTAAPPRPPLSTPIATAPPSPARLPVVAQERDRTTGAAEAAPPPPPDLRPAAAETFAAQEILGVSSPPPPPPPPPPIHVRIGRIEVRDVPTGEPRAVAPPRSAPLGFAEYASIRTYRSSSR